MTDDLSPAAVVRRLDRGQQVVIPSSNRQVLFGLLVALVIGIGLLAFFIYVVTATIEDGRSPWLIIINLRMWALVIGIVGCLVVAPIGLFARMRRRESLVLSPVGVALARRDQVLPGTLLPWQDIEAIVFEKAARRGPKAAAYILTERRPSTTRARASSAVTRQEWFCPQSPSTLPGPESRTRPFRTAPSWAPIGPHMRVPYC